MSGKKRFVTCHKCGHSGYIIIEDREKAACPRCKQDIR